MDVMIFSGTPRGRVKIPGSKSYTHRALICAALADGVSTITNALRSDDTDATSKALSDLGAHITYTGDVFTVQGTKSLKAPPHPINCSLSGSTIRFMTALAAKASGKIILDGAPSLRSRPMQPLLDALTQLGIKVESENGHAPITVFGNPHLQGGTIKIRGDVSSQYVTGLMFLAPLCPKGMTIILTTHVESAPYLSITRDVLRAFGIHVSTTPTWSTITISPQQYTPTQYSVEADFSSAAFMLAAGAIGGDVTITNMGKYSLESAQGDKKIIDVLAQMEADVRITDTTINVRQSELRGTTIDVSDTPDLVPILAVLGCYAQGETIITGASRVRLKESDRLSSITTELRKMGAEIDEKPDGLVVKKSRLRGARIYHHHDHRIVMACSIAALAAEGNTIIEGAEHCAKSYPSFFEDLQRVGIKIEK